MVLRRIQNYEKKKMCRPYHGNMTKIEGTISHKTCLIVFRGSRLYYLKLGKNTQANRITFDPKIRFMRSRCADAKRTVNR